MSGPSWELVAGESSSRTCFQSTAIGERLPAVPAIGLEGPGVQTTRCDLSPLRSFAFLACSHIRQFSSLGCSLHSNVPKAYGAPGQPKTVAVRPLSLTTDVAAKEAIHGGAGDDWSAHEPRTSHSRGGCQKRPLRWHHSWVKLVNTRHVTD